MKVITLDKGVGLFKLKQEIVKAGRVETEQILGKMGKNLEENLFHDTALSTVCQHGKGDNLIDAYVRGIYVREFLAYPERNGVWNKKRDLVNPYGDSSRKIILPASDIPSEVIGERRVGLKITPKSIELDTIAGEELYILNKEKIAIISSFIQTSANLGKMDLATGIPIEVPLEELNSLRREEIRSLWRVEEEGLYPIIRRIDAYHDGEFLTLNLSRTIIAGIDPRFKLPVAYFEKDTE